MTESLDYVPGRLKVLRHVREAFSWAATNMARRYGRAPRGSACELPSLMDMCEHPLGRKQNLRTARARDRVLTCVRPLMLT